MSKELALDGLGAPASTPNAEVAPFFLGERAGRASSVTRSRRARWSVIQEIPQSGRHRFWLRTGVAGPHEGCRLAALERGGRLMSCHYGKGFFLQR